MTSGSAGAEATGSGALCFGDGFAGVGWVAAAGDGAEFPSVMSWLAAWAGAAVSRALLVSAARAALPGLLWLAAAGVEGLFPLFLRLRYPAEQASNTTAATITMAFVLPPPSTSSGSYAPGKNVGGATSLVVSTLTFAVFGSGTSCTTVLLMASAGSTLGAGVLAFSTAGAAAAAWPCAWNIAPDITRFSAAGGAAGFAATGSCASTCPAASAARRSADAIGSAIFAEGCQGNLLVPADVPATGPGDALSVSGEVNSSMSASRIVSESSSSTSATDAEATMAGKLGAGTGFCVGTAGAAGFEVAAFEAAAGASAEGFAGVAAALTGTAGGALAAGATFFAGSFPLRSSPRATRNVPLACSTLMGLVRTRLAPMRNAFATPAWPSTTATASDDWFELELRALLNRSVAFCSLSQSTTTASKCCAINFLTAANGSVQGSTVKSRSFRTCVTLRAVFSSGQNSNAW